MHGARRSLLAVGWAHAQHSTNGSGNSLSFPLRFLPWHPWTPSTDPHPIPKERRVCNASIYLDEVAGLDHRIHRLSVTAAAWADDLLRYPEITCHSSIDVPSLIPGRNQVPGGVFGRALSPGGPIMTAHIQNKANSVFGEWSPRYAPRCPAPRRRARHLVPSSLASSNLS